MITQRGRSRKQPAPHRALDAEANYSRPKQQAKKRRSKAGPSSPPSTPPSSPPTSPNTPVMNSTPPPHVLGQHDSLTLSGSREEAGAASTALEAAAGEAPAPITGGDGDMAAAATATMLAAMQQAAAINAAAAAAAATVAAAAAKKRKKPSGASAAAAAAGNSRQGAGKKGKGGPSLPLKPGLCSFCGETQSPMWRKGPEQYPRLCNRCGMRYSRNRNDLPKAFSDKVAARIQAERQRSASSQASDIGDMQGLDASAFDEGFDSLPSSPYSTDAAPAAGMSALLAQHALLLLAPAAAASGRTHSRCDSADNSMATAGTLADNDSGLMSDFEAAVAAVAAMAAAAPAAAAASGDGRSKSSRARRSTEKVAALQGRQARRSQGLARMATGNETRSAHSALLDLVAQLSAEAASSIKAEPTDEVGHTGPYAAQHSDDISTDEAEDTELVDGNGSGSRAGKRRRGPSRLAMATYADAGAAAAMSAAAAGSGGGAGAMSWEALVAAASIDREAEEAASAAAAAASAAAAAVSTGMSQHQLSARRAQLAFQRAVDEGYAATQHAASQQQGMQAAWSPADAFGPPAFAAAPPAQPAEGPRHEPLPVDLLAQLLHQIAGQPQHHHLGPFAAANPAPARLPEHYGPVDYAPVAAMQQQQQPALQFLMHQTALQVVLQQPAGAGAFSQGQLANSMTTLQGPCAPPSAGPVNSPAPAGAAAPLPPVMPLVRAAGMLDHPAMQQLMQQQVQSLLGMTAAYGASAHGQNARTGPH